MNVEIQPVVEATPFFEQFTVLHIAVHRASDLYRDCDTAEEQLAKSFRDELPNIEIIDKSDIYAGNEDLNDWYASVGRTTVIQSR